MIKLKSKTTEVSAEARKKAELGWQRLFERKDIGFFRVTERPGLWGESRHRAEDTRRTFTRLAVLGIGGSSLGGRAALQAMNLKGVEFFENVDGRDFWDRIAELGDLSKVHFAIISKSGSTLETLAQAALLDQVLEERGLRLANQATVVSETGNNSLTRWAREHKVPILELPKDIGGRFSVLTPVGLFPLAFAGVRVDDVREGAAWALTQQALVVELAAQAIESFNRKEFVTLFWTYSSRMKDFGLWIQQLWAESLAKRVDRAGRPAPDVSTPVPLVGANDQHSILQQVAEGRRDKFVWFFKVRDAETFGTTLKKATFDNQNFVVGKRLGDLLAAEQRATEMALFKDEVKSLTLELNELDAEALGALFMTFELVVATVGEALDIDTFDQPGVELGKRIAKDILEGRV